MTTQPTLHFDDAVKKFVKLLQEMDDKDPTYNYSIDPNDAKKYMKIVTESKQWGQSKSVYCFIGMLPSDPETYGMILKPASYQAAERKNPRGSIFDENPIKYCGRFGLEYMNEKNVKDRIESELLKKVRLLKEKITAKGGYSGHTRELIQSAEEKLSKYGALNKASMIEMNELWKAYTDAV